MTCLRQAFLAAALVCCATPALAVTTNSLGVTSSAGTGSCGTATFPGPNPVVSSGAGAISFDRQSSGPASPGVCAISYGAAAGFGSVGAGATMTGTNSGGNGDSVMVGATTNFQLAFSTPADWVNGDLVDLSIRSDPHGSTLRLGCLHQRKRAVQRRSRTLGVRSSFREARPRSDSSRSDTCDLQRNPGLGATFPMASRT